MLRISSNFAWGMAASAALAGLLVVPVGCGSSKPRAAGGANVGSIGLELQIAPEVQLNSIAYDISGNAFSRAGTLDVSASTTITARLGNIPAGNGYVITLTAMDASGAGISCQGSAPFNITAGMTTTAVVRMQCHLPQRTGSVLVTGTINVCPRLDSLSVEPAETTVGHSVSLSGAATDIDRLPAPIAFAWTSTGGSLTAAASPTAALTCTTEGPITVTLTVGDGDCSDTASAIVTCSAGAEADATIRFNEIESNGGVPGDWAELFNPAASAIDISGFVFKDNDDTHAYVIPTPTIVPPGGYVVLEEAAFGFGLGGADSVRLYDYTGVILVDSHTWPAHAPVTYGRCPNGVGAFTATSSTKGEANSCGGGSGGAGGAGGGSGGSGGAGGASGGPGGAGGSVVAAWPGANAVVTVDAANTFGGNMSGLTYQAAAGAEPAVLWAAQNSPSKIYKLVWNGTIWTSTTTNDWGAGKLLRYPAGTGNPDTESVTRAEAGSSAIYIASERDNDNSGVSRLVVLRFDGDASGAALTATHEWNLTTDLPAVGANLGLEAITWIPDSHLLARGFIDESTGATYDPARYPDHGTGIFLVGIEANGTIYAYALDHVANTFHRLATIASGHAGVMGIDFDRDVGYLWAHCDNTCGNRTSVLDIVTDAGSALRGRFQVRRQFARPTTLSDLNHEGIAIAPESECVNNLKSFFWSDDGESEGHAIRRDSIPCGAFL